MISMEMKDERSLDNLVGRRESVLRKKKKTKISKRYEGRYVFCLSSFSGN